MEVLSWNVQAGIGVDGRADLDRVAAAIREGGEPDVICLQEVAQGYPGVDGGRGEDQVAALAERFPGHRPFFGAAVDRAGPGAGRRRFGNLILARPAVSQIFTHPLPQPAAPGLRHMPRQATEAVVADGAGSLRIVTTHLEFHVPAQREAQVRRLLELQREVADNCAAPPLAAPEGPYEAVPRPASTVLCGDFNFRPGDPEHASLTGVEEPAGPAFADAWAHLHGAGSHRPTCGIFDREQWPEGPHCRDFFLVTPDLLARVVAVEVDERTDASDHQPIRLRLAPPAR